MFFRLVWSPIQTRLAQQLTKGSRIGFVSVNSPDSEAPGIEQLPHELHDLRNVEGKTILIEHRFAGTKLERLPELAPDLVGLRPDAPFAGCLIRYRASLAPNDRRSPVYVGKIFKNAKPSGSPAEQLTKFAYVINRKSARQIVLAISPNVLARADRVIR